MIEELEKIYRIQQQAVRDFLILSIAKKALEDIADTDSIDWIKERTETALKKIKELEDEK